MPKMKCSDSAKLKGCIQESGEQHFSTDGKILFCKLCEVRVTAGIVFQQSYMQMLSVRCKILRNVCSLFKNTMPCLIAIQNY
jgi:hypothetical protein